MVNPPLVEFRLTALGLTDPRCESPGDVLRTLGPVQGQELTGVGSSISLRLAADHAGDRSGAVRDAFAAGSIVRGYPMRATVFAMAAEDATWLTQLCAGPQRRQSRHRLEQLGLTPSEVNAATTVVETHPEGLSRTDFTSLWTQLTGVDADAVPSLPYLLVRDLMLHGLAVYGPTLPAASQLIVPSEAWLPAGNSLAERFNGDATAATAELLLRYLRGHGPAGLRDFSWWTKLPVKLVRDAFSLVRSVDNGIERSASFDEALGEEAWTRPGLADEVAALRKKAHGTFLLPAFDELMLGYRNRLTFLEVDHHDVIAPGNNGSFRKTVVRGGRFIATWSAPGTGGGRQSGPLRRLEVSALHPLSAAALRDIDRVFRSYPHP